MEFQRSPTAFGNVAPWKNLNAPSVGVNFTYAWAPDLFVNVEPTVAWTYESGANTGDALDLWRRRVGREGVSRPISCWASASAPSAASTRRRRCRSSSSTGRSATSGASTIRSQAGPAGGAGLEVVYSPDDRWEIRRGLTYRSYRFRLATDNATPSGIGENSFIPLFLRVTRKLTKDARLDFYGAIVTGGKLKVDTESGGGLYSDNYKIGPALGATLVVNF